MSYTSKFLEALEEEEKKKKKKEEERASYSRPARLTTTGNITEWNAFGRMTDAFDDFAPIGRDVVVPSRSTPVGEWNTFERHSDIVDVTYMGGATPRGGFAEEDPSEDDVLLGLFQAGSFKDGFDWEDIPTAILGTVGDVGLNVLKAPAQLIEGIGDAVNYGRASVHEAITGDEFEANVIRNLAKQNDVENLTDDWQKYLDQYSLLGETGKGVAQGVGQLATMAGLAYVGGAAGLGASKITALTSGTMGVSSMGSGMSEAYQSGATDEEALLYGTIAGASDAISEMIFGGMGKSVNALGFNRGLLSADDLLAKQLSKNIQSTLGKNLVQFGVKSAAEGLEEVIAGTAQAVGKKLTYMSEEDIGKIIEDEKLLEQFVVGALTSAIGQGSTLINSVKTGSDLATGYTNDEQTVIDRVTEEMIAEREKKSGKELTHAEQTEIQQEVERNLENGFITAEKIEEILGGESYENFKNEWTKFGQSEEYKAWKEADKTEKQNKAEFDDLVKMKQGDMTGEQVYRRDELKKLLDESKVGEMKAKLDVEATRIGGIRNKMRSEVMQRVQGSRLQESYYELIRSKQKFQVDVNQYKNENARKTVESIIKSGLGDNSRKFHHTVDFLAKLSAEKGMTFDLTNNDRLKGTKHYKEGYITNGYVTDNGDVVLNMDSSKALNTTVGHEVTHVLEKAGVYQELQNAVRDFAIAREGLKGYNARIKAAEEAYEGKNNTTPEGEVTADLIGEYIFTDYDFVHNLSTKNRNVFQKIYDEIKYMVKVATAGSQEAKALLKAKKMFDKAYRDNVKGKPEPKAEETKQTKGTVDPENDSDLDYESPVKYSVTVTDPDTIDFLENQEHITTYKAMLLIDGKLYPPMASKVKGEDGKYHMTNPRELGEWMQAEEDTTNIKFNDKGIGYYDLKKDDGGTVRAAYNPYEHSSNLVLNDQFEAAYKRENLVTVECVIPVSEMDGAYRAEHAKDATGMMDWHSGTVASKLTDNKRSVYLSRYLKAVRVLSDAEVAQKYKEIVGDISVPFNVVSPGLLTELENVGVNIDYDGSPQYQSLQRRAAEREAKKNAKYSMTKADSDYMDAVENGDTETAQQILDDVANEAGYTIKAYHGTGYDFTVFDKSRQGDNYQNWGRLGKGFYFAPTTREAQTWAELSRGGKNKVMPVYLRSENMLDSFEALPDDLKDTIPEDWDSLTKRLAEKYAYHYIDYMQEFGHNVQEVLVSKGYDGINGHVEFVVFDPEQVKSADPVTYDDDGNVIPLSERFKKDNDDIRYSMTKDSEGRDLTAEQQEFFKDSKLRDEDGRLIPMYHGTNSPDFTVFDPQYSDDKTSLFFTSDPEVANTYTMAQDYGRDVDPYNLITKDSSAEQFNKAQERVGGGLRVVKVTKDWIAEMKAKAESAKQNYINEVSEIADEIEEASRGDVAPFFDVYLKNIREELASGKVWGSDLGYSLNRLQSSLTFLKNRKLERSLSNKLYDVKKTLDTVRAYEDSVVGEEYVGQYVYTETNSLVPFVARGKTDSYFTHIIPGTESELVEKALDRMKWVKEHNLGNRYKVYLNLTNPFILDTGTDYSGVMDRVSLEHRDGEWTVEMETAEDDITKYMRADEFNAFVESTFDAETAAKIKAQIEADNEAYRKEWDDLEPRYVNHDIQLENVNVSYIEPGKWSSLKFNGSETAKTRDVAAWAKANGYDGVIFKNMKDSGGYAAHRGRGASTVAVAFDSNKVKSVENAKPTADPDIRYSMTKADTEYEEAIFNEDNETAQHLLDEAARAAGYTIKAYHGTRSGEFFVFDKNRIGDNYSGYNAAGGGFDFSTDEDRAFRWGDMAKGLDPIRTIPVYLKAEKTFYNYEEVPSDLESTLPEGITEAEKEQAMSAGYAYRKILEKYGIDFKQAIISKGYDSYSMYQGYENIAVYNPSQIKSAKLVTTNPETGEIIPLSERFKKDNDDIRYSMTKAEQAKMDDDYLKAVESGDEEVQKHLVREYAKAMMPNSKLVDENGNLRMVYHGTNTGDFNVFNPDYIGMSSGDDGFFGRGFYFAYSKGEASYYGASRVIPAYLNLTNPFDFEKELQTYNGEKAMYGHAPDAVALMNFADKFPDIAMSITLGSVKNGESSGKSISVFQFAKEFKDIIENKEFEYQELVNEYGETETLVTADPQVHEYEYNGETHSYRDYGFQKRWYRKPNKLDVAYEYLSNAVYSYLDIPRRTNVILDNNREFTEELKNRGYDGTIQSEYGDEAVAFYPNQIKSAKPVTYDDDGNVIPLSKRFDSEQDDIRYSLSGDDHPTAGNWHIYGKDFGDRDPLSEFDIAPMDISKTETTTEKSSAVGDNIAPTVSKEEKVGAVETVQDRVRKMIDNATTELETNRQLREDAYQDFEERIKQAEAELASKKNQNTKTANDIKQRIARLKRLQADSDATFSKRISDLEKRVEKYRSKEFTRAEVRRDVQGKMTQFWNDLIGDTSSWKDLPLGLAYKTKTLRRILRAVVKDGRGNPDIQLADAIYDELETKYDHHEAQLKMESQKLKESFKDMDLTHEEDTYAQMLGELRHNPETELSREVVEEYYNKNRKKIDPKKVDRAIAESRKLYDELFERVNKVLKAQGIKEIEYRKGYFPHFTKPKQGWLAKLLNWKTIDTEIPTSIAGLTQDFKPQKSWQSFAQRRRGDTTDYSLYQGLDTYIHGALDWIYHIEDLQSRRALENHIRFIHSDEGIQQRIKEIYADDSLDALEIHDRINSVLDEAQNPLGGLVRELQNRTNTLANKKSSMDREMEDLVNRKAYSTMTNINNRVTANMVVGSFSSALTNFIPMVQSWHQVSPVYTVRGLKDMIHSTIHDDGVIAKSDFLTNRLVKEDNLYKTGWDKVSDKASMMMDVVDNITSQAVWRSKYLQNLNEGMSESAAIKDADQFAKNLMAGRSRGNAPSIFDAKNPVTKIFTAFQLEVANQYGYMFEDVPQDTPNKTRLVKGYATAFLGAYLYNALYSSLVGRDAAFDPISIIEELFKDLFDDDEEDEEAIMNLGANILEEVPYIGGLLGGGRIPLASAFPYANYNDPLQSVLNDTKKLWNEGKPFEGEWVKRWTPLVKEMLKPLYYLVLPVGGGQMKKLNEGMAMFSDEHPVSGSYTSGGNLRFPVEDTIPNRIQAALFGQYASENARNYFDNNRSAMGENQIQEYMDVDLPIADYWNYRDGLKGLSTNKEKADFINSLDIEPWQKNLLMNNILDRDEDVDMTDYGNYSGWDEFDYAQKNPEKYDLLNSLGVSYEDYTTNEETKNAVNWAYDHPDNYMVSKAVTSDVVKYRQYATDLDNILEKDENGNKISTSVKERKIAYINGLDIEYGAKMVLFKNEYKSDDTYNAEIFEYIKGREDLSLEEKMAVLKKLGFTVYDDGTVEWD
jgi:hypothetical protein